jgi:hypothetical protein
MNLKLTRKVYTDNSTIGELEIDGKFECYILEDVVRMFKIFGNTAIPEGKYLIALTPSEKFKRTLPELLNVPKYTGIRIHTGNSAVDTEGCLITGCSMSKDWVSKSKIAFESLYEKLIGAFSLYEIVSIEIINTQAPKVF